MTKTPTISRSNGEILIENLRIGEYVASEVSDGASSAYVLPADKTASVFEGAVTNVWVRCSVQMMTGFFPFLSYDEIRYALKRLVKGRVLTKGRFNESCFDRTNWYAFTELGQFLMTESEGRTQ